MLSLKEKLAKECNLPIKWVDEVIFLGSTRVKKLKIAKKNSNNKRYIDRPSSELEIVQRWLAARVFSKLKIHDCAAAFVPGRDILSNAQTHQNSKYFIRVDFENFFLSIKHDDLIKTLRAPPNSMIIDVDDERLIRATCFNGQLRLPIGYISSPVISNAVMYQFDKNLDEHLFSKSAELGNFKLTRYADDIVFSTDTKGACAKFLKLFQSYVKSVDYPKLKINGQKTIFSSRAGGSAIVTGLRVCSDTHITATRQYKDQIRLMLSLYEKDKLKDEDTPKLRGHLSYIRHVAPAFYSRMCLKYLKAIKELQA